MKWRRRTVSMPPRMFGLRSRLDRPLATLAQRSPDGREILRYLRIGNAESGSFVGQVKDYYCPVLSLSPGVLCLREGAMKHSERVVGSVPEQSVEIFYDAPVLCDPDFSQTFHARIHVRGGRAS